jgi:hypothetical protein
MHAFARHAQARLSLELKTRPRFHPVCLSFTMLGPVQEENLNVADTARLDSWLLKYKKMIKINQMERNIRFEWADVN